MKHLKTVRSFDLFCNLSEQELSDALALFDAHTAAYKKGACLHESETAMDCFGLLLSGAVQVCIHDADGNRSIMAEVSPGMSFAESLCFLEIENSPVDIFAGEACEVLWLRVKKLYSAPPDAFVLMLQRRFTALLARRTLLMNDRIQVLSKLRLREKLLTYFRRTAQLCGSDTFCLSIGRDDLAAYVGTNRSALCRELSKMKQDGLIDYYRNTIRLL